MISPLRERLEEDAGWEAFQMIIPHPFLPPRFRELARERNMILLLDQDMTLHIRWEGARMHEHHPLTPGAVRRLIKEVLRYMTQYRRELKVLARFIDGFAEMPFEDDRPLDPIQWPKKKGLTCAFLEEKEEEDQSIEVGAEVEIVKEKREPLPFRLNLSKFQRRYPKDLPVPSELGGEAPMGGGEFNEY